MIRIHLQHILPNTFLFFCVFFARIIISLHFSAQLLVIRMCASCIISSFFFADLRQNAERITMNWWLHFHLFRPMVPPTFPFAFCGANDTVIRSVLVVAGCHTRIMCFMVRRAFDLMASLSSYFSLCTHLTFTFRFVRVWATTFCLFIFLFFFGSGQFEIYLLVSCLNTATRKKKNNEKSTGRWVVCENSDTRKTLMRICIQFCWFAAAVNDLLSNH